MLQIQLISATSASNTSNGVLHSKFFNNTVTGICSSIRDVASLRECARQLERAARKNLQQPCQEVVQTATNNNIGGYKPLTIENGRLCSHL